MKTIRTFQSPTGVMPKPVKARVVYDADWEDYIVQVWIDGKRREAADYHAYQDKADAIATALHMCGLPRQD